MITEDFYGIITEDYVSFNIAKLLKEKGFMDGAIVKFFASGYDKNGNILSIEKTELKDYPRPTLQMAMKWLRERYNICIELHFHPNKNDWGWYFTLLVIDNVKKCFRGFGPYETYSSYEEACEAAIMYCLENLI